MIFVAYESSCYIVLISFQGRNKSCHLHTTYTDNSSSKDDSLTFIKVLMLYDEIVKVIMTMLPFTQLSHSELFLF